MAFTLAFSIGLSLVLLLGALFISKSDLSVNEKSFSIIAILSLFCLVSIVNEAKKPPTVEIKLPSVDFNRTFTDFLPGTDLRPEYWLPILEGTKDFVTKSLGDWDPENSRSYQFCLLYSEDKVGKTYSIKQFVEKLHQRQIPALYIELKNPEMDVDKFAKALKLSNLNSLENMVEKFNKQGKAPNFFIDNIQNAFLRDDGDSNLFPCPVCEYFKSMFDKKHVNIVFITNDIAIKEHFRSNESYNKRVNIFGTYQRTFQDVDNYLLEKVNVNIRRDEKKFTSENIRMFLRNFGWNFQILNEYMVNLDIYENFPIFVDKYIQKKSQEIVKAEFFDLISILLSLAPQERRENNWISYGLIKKNYPGNPSEKLDKAIQAKVLKNKGNQYRFKNLSLYKAALAVQEPK